MLSSLSITVFLVGSVFTSLGEVFPLNIPYTEILQMES